MFMAKLRDDGLINRGSNLCIGEYAQYEAPQPVRIQLPQFERQSLSYWM